MSRRVEIAQEQPEEFVMPGEGGPSEPVADVVFVRERGVDYLLYRAEGPSPNGNHNPPEDSPKGDRPRRS